MSRIFSLFLVLSVSILFLIFIGFSEGKRIYPKLQLENICSKAELYEHRIEQMLKFGFDIRNEHFKKWAEELAGENSITSASIIPYEHYRNAANGDVRLLCEGNKAENMNFVSMGWGHLLNREKEKYFQVELFLENQKAINNAEQAVGVLSLTVSSEEFMGPIHTTFKNILYISAVLFIIALAAFRYAQQRETPNLPFYSKLIFHGTYALIALAVFFSLLTLFKDGIREKSVALSNSLNKRLSVAVDMCLDLERDISEVDLLLRDYLRQDEDISAIEVYKNRTIIYSAYQRNYSRSAPVEACKDEGILACQTLGQNRAGGEYQCEHQDLALKVLVEKSAVYKKLFRAVRNLLLLCIATTLISNLFLNLMSVYQSRQGMLKGEKVTYQQGVKLARPIFALGVLTEALHLSFLPEFMQSVASNGWPVSVIFSVYFLCFALVLNPAGRYASRHSIRNVMAFALLLVFSGLLLLSLSSNLYQIVVARALSAFGQGILIVAIQSYLLRLDDGSSASAGSDEIVLGFNIGMVSGAAVGALLVSILGMRAVFFIAMFVALFCIVCVYRLLSDIPHPTLVKKKKASWTSIFNFEFLKTTVLIGIPTKAVFTGVLIFSLPVIFAFEKIPKDEVGQILILYSFGLLLVTYFLNQIMGIIRSPALTLLIGTVGAGIALFLIGAQKIILDELTLFYQCEEACIAYQKLIIAIGVFILGCFHGLINAPVVAYITQIPGQSSPDRPVFAANYRMIERLGHVLGPSIAGILLVSGSKPQYDNIMYLAAFIALTGVLFYFIRSSSKEA